MTGQDDIEPLSGFKMSFPGLVLFNLELFFLLNWDMK